MPSPNCTRCEGRTFAAGPDRIEAGKGGVLLVFCATCGAVVGAVPA